MSGGAARSPAKPLGLARLNMPDGPAPPDATIIVSGPPRSGTSFVAAALHAAHLWLGDLIDKTVFEDVELSDALPADWQLSRRVDRPWLRPFDSRALIRRVAERDAAFPRWGFKQPNISAPLVGRSGQALFRNPRLVMIFRDPVALAERAAMAEGLDIDKALWIARRHNDLNLRTARHATIPVLFASYEKVVAKRDAFFAELYDFCGLAIDPSDYPRIGAAVETAGESYLRMAAAPISGYLNRYTDGVLYGWCRVAGHPGPESVDVYADGVKVATARADVYRPALRKAGIGRGRHGFEVRIDHLTLAETCVVRVMATSGVEITNSGRTLAELKTSA